MHDEIRLGQYWLVRASVRELVVRLESKNPTGGWTGRIMSNGRKIDIPGVDRLLRRCEPDEPGLEGVPNRRSRALPPEPKDFSTKRKDVMPKEEEKETASLGLMSLLDAAAMVLRTKKTPLTTREIITLILERGFWSSEGATPWATLNAALNREIQSGGENSRFRKKGRGRYILR